MVLSRPISILGVVAVVLATPTFAQTPQSPSLAAVLQPHGYAAIPLTPAPEYGDGQYTVQTTLNTTPATLLFDSGFNGPLTTHQEQADAAGLHAVSMGTVEGINGQSSLDTAHLKTFGIDSLQFGSLPISVGQFPMADGAIGAHFMSTHGTILDYSHDMLYVQANPAATDFPADALKRAGDVVIPIKREKGKGDRAGYYVEAKVNDTTRLFLIDTGWGGSSFNLDRERATAFGMQDPAHGTFKLETITVETDFSLMDLSAIRKKQLSVNMPQLDGVIGCGFLKEHGAIIDFTKGVMYLRP